MMPISSRCPRGISKPDRYTTSRWTRICPRCCRGLSKIFQRARARMYKPFIWLVRIYQWTVSPFLPSSCRFIPCCSDYALQALRIHGLLRGGLLTVKRLLRCHPLAKPGYDPVPDKIDGENLCLTRIVKTKRTPVCSPGVLFRGVRKEP